MSFWYEGLHFECTSCGHCCRHEPGYVFLSRRDLKRLASFRNMNEKEFIGRYCRSVDLGIARRLSLTETPENDCIFWDGGCTVYDARPLQCRTYPFWPAILESPSSWEQEGRECPGIGLGRRYSKEEIQDALNRRSDDILISPGR